VTLESICSCVMGRSKAIGFEIRSSSISSANSSQLGFVRIHFGGRAYRVFLLRIRISIGH